MCACSCTNTEMWEIIICIRFWYLLIHSTTTACKMVSNWVNLPLPFTVMLLTYYTQLLSSVKFTQEAFEFSRFIFFSFTFLVHFTFLGNVWWAVSLNACSTMHNGPCVCFNDFMAITILYEMLSPMRMCFMPNREVKSSWNAFYTYRLQQPWIELKNH